MRSLEEGNRCGRLGDQRGSDVGEDSRYGDEGVQVSSQQYLTAGERRKARKLSKATFGFQGRTLTTIRVRNKEISKMAGESHSLQRAESR